MVLLVTLKFRLHIVTKTAFAATSKVLLLTFICKNLSQSYRVSYKDHPINQISLNISNDFTETEVLDKQECYFLGDLNINLLLDEKKIFSKKSYSTNGQKLAASNKGLSRFLLLLFPGTTYFFELVIELGISEHDLVYCARKLPSFKLNKRKDTSIRSTKNCTREKFLELLRKTDFPDYTTFTCLNKAYQDFIFKLIEVIDLLCPSKN